MEKWIVGNMNNDTSNSQQAYEILENYIHEVEEKQQVARAQRIIARMLDRMTPAQRAEICQTIIR